LAIVSGGPDGTAALTFATGRFDVAQGRSATVRLVFTRAGRGELQLERTAYYTVAARARTGAATVTTARTVTFRAPPRGFATDLLPERPGRCLPPRAQTVVRSARSRIYRLRGSDGVVHAYGCLNAVGRGFPLEDVDDLGNGNQFLPPYALAGPYVGYQDTYSFEEGAAPGYYDVTVRVVDLRTGRTVRRACAEPGCYEDVDALVLAPSGVVAWIARKRVWRLAGRAKKPQRLSRGGGLKLDSLKLRGSRLSWVQEGRTHHAMLR
jgi:hypothetical protein